MRKRNKLIRRLGTGIVLTFAVVSTVQAVSHDEVREPVVKFIDFYVASQQADAPPMTLWERVIYGIAVAKTPQRSNAVLSPCR